jgi:hypothetical protein
VVIFIGLYFVRSGMRAAGPSADSEEEMEEVSLAPGKN